MQTLKKKKSAIFYSVTVEDDEIQSILDAIKIIANPTTKSPAHITVKGPMRNRISKAKFDKYNSYTDNDLIHILQIGTFKTDDRFTVFMEVEKSESIERLWFKPDFPEGTAHLTIYDGPKTTFSLWLFDKLNKFKWDFRLPIGMKFEEFSKTPSLLYLEQFRKIVSEIELKDKKITHQIQNVVPENWDENLRKTVVSNLVEKLNSKFQTSTI